MDFELIEEQRQLQRTLREFVAREVAPRAAEVDEQERFPAETFEALGRMGLLGIAVGKEYGGSGADFISCLVAMEALAQGCASTALSFGAHAILCAHNLWEFGDERQRRRYLPDLSSGRVLGAFALTEPGAGSDASGIETVAKKSQSGYTLSGTKTLITNGPIAGTFLVFARTAAAAKAGRTGAGISLFIVERGFPGFSVGRTLKKLGTRGSPTSELVFDDCRVPAENLVGREGDGHRMMLRALDVERVVFSGMPLGIAGAALEYAVRYARQRRQFGRPIGEFQLVGEMLSNMATQLEAARWLAYRAAALLDAGRPVTKEASYAKLFAAEMVTRAASDAVQIFGGYGYMREFPVERLLRDARLIPIGGGTSQIQQMIIARELLREDGQAGGEQYRGAGGEPYR